MQVTRIVGLDQQFENPISNIYDFKVEFLQLKILKLDMNLGPRSFPDSFFEDLTQRDEHMDERRLFQNIGVCGYIGIDPTVEPEQQIHDALQNFAFRKSDKRDYKISFEESFMEQHQRAFQKQTENFIEQCLNKNNFPDISNYEQLWWEKNFENEEKDDSINVLLFEQNSLVIKELEKHEKLGQYFQKIQQKVWRPVINEFHYLGYLAMKKYEEIQNPSLDEDAIVEQCSKLANSELEKLLKDERIRFLNLREFWKVDEKVAGYVKDAFKDYLHFFFATFMLIKEEYFCNPFSQAFPLKRQRPQTQNTEEGNHGIFGLVNKRIH